MRKSLFWSWVLLASALLFASCGKPSSGTEKPGNGTEIEKPEPEPEPDPEPEFKEEPDDPAGDPVRTFDYSKLMEKGHPRLLMSAGDFDDLKVKVTSGRFENKTLYKMHKLVLDLADDYCTSSTVLEYKLDASSKRLLDQSREALKRLFACAYAYRLTGKSKYLQKAAADLRTVCSFPDWHPSHYLDVGEMALGVAVAYDWLYYELSYEDRVRARRCLSTFAVNTAPGQSFYNSEGNWNQVCNAGVIAAALAVYEKDKARSINVIEEGVASNARIMKVIYSPDGNYSEGYDYWGYGTGFQVVLLQLLNSVFGNCAGLDATEGFDKTAGYMLFMAGPCGKDFSYADGGVGSERPKLGMWWFAAMQNDPSLLLNEMRLYNNDMYASSDEIRLAPMIPCMIKDVNLDNFTGAVPSKNIWYGRGVTPMVMVHTGWNFDSGDAYVGIKGGKAGSSHGHMDAGSFVFDSQGVRWSMDYTRPSYSTIENALSSAGGNFWTMTQKSLRWDVMKMNNLVHSTLTCANSDGSVKNKLHITDHNVSGSATLEEVIEEDGRLGATFDLTAPLSDALASARRTVVLKGGRELEVVDVITAKAGMDADVQWRMITPATVQIENGREVLTQSGRTLYLKVSSSSASAVPSLTTWSPSRPSGWTARSWDTGLTGTVAGYTVTVPAGSTVTLTTLLTPDI